jgi:DNA-binding XRE family transcriptional regulator
MQMTSARDLRTFRAILKIAFPKPIVFTNTDTRPPKSEVADRFRGLRRKALFTQERLAGLIGIGRQALNKIENQRSLPHQTTWDAFCSLESKHNQPPIILPEKWT